MQRRKFVNQVLTASLALSVTDSILGLAFSRITSSHKAQNNLVVMLQQASLLRKSNQISGALVLYEQIITAFPQDIRGYDGKRLCLVTTKHTELEVLNMYAAARQQFPQNQNFRVRWAKCAMAIALGNAKYANQINSQTQLLAQARQIFNQLRQSNPDNLQYDALFKKARRKFNQNATSVDARANQNIKDFKKTQRSNYKKRFQSNSIPDLQARLEENLNLPVNEKRNAKIRELYLVLIRKVRKEKNFTILFPLLEQYYQWQPSDEHTLFIIRRICSKRKNFIFLENIERQNHITKNTAWSAVALADSIIKLRRKENIGNLNEIPPLLQSIEPQVSDAALRFEIELILTTIKLMQNNLLETRTKLIELGELIEGVNNKDFTINYTVLTARYYRRMQQTQKMNTVFSLALEESDDFLQDELLEMVYNINSYVQLTEHKIDVLQKIRNRFSS
jgi:KaiC/GvpD/RAD55 family RecA-like ATPase